MAEQPIGYLLGLGPRPHPLHPGKELTFGRDPASNSHALKDPLLSRRHLRLEIQASGLVVLEDLGSTNGTRLNDQPVVPGMQLPVRSGDNIQFGRQSLTLVADEAKEGFDASFAANVRLGRRVSLVIPSQAKMPSVDVNSAAFQEAVSGKMEKGATLVGALTPEEMEKLNQPCPLEGRLEEQLFPQLLQYLHSSKKTGELIVQHPGGEALIAYDSGDIVFAVQGELKGVDVVGLVGEKPAGPYAFKDLPENPHPHEIKFPTKSIILQCCHTFGDG